MSYFFTNSCDNLAELMGDLAQFETEAAKINNLAGRKRR